MSQPTAPRPESAATLGKKLNEAQAASAAQEQYPQWDLRRLLISAAIIAAVLAFAIVYG